jgi:biofilm PGA synthesis N-glycosyltransferase PgaC
VSVVVAAHDEGARIAERIENLLALDYPRDRLEIVIGSDGSTDDTVERARAFEPEGVRVVPFAARRGKAAALNDLVPACRGEIVLLADARQRFEPQALRELMRPLADPDVGAVGGVLLLSRGGGAAGVAEGVGFYWRYETFIRERESRVDSTVGATGAIYALRRDLFRPIPEDTVLDDVLIPMRIVRAGRRVVLQPSARAHEEATRSPRREFARKVRTIAGNFQLLAREPWLLDPFRNRLWLQTVSHKGLRLLGPALCAAVLASSLVLAERPLYGAALAAQAAFYAAALWSALDLPGARARWLALPHIFCLLNAATLMAFFRFVSGRQSVTWERLPETDRDITPPPLRISPPGDSGHR